MPISPGRSLVAALITAAPLLAQSVPVIEKTLPNGLRLLMVERHDKPTIECCWIVKAGSVNERPGITGMAHMLEHMMKKGTRVVGTRDPKRDQELILEQDRVWSEIRKEEGILRDKQKRGEIEDMYDPKNRSERHQKLVDEFNKLVQEQDKIVVKEEYDKIYRSHGAVGRNAFTGQDVTCHLITIPSNKLELYTWMESDRLRNAVFREFYQERGVVRDERRGVENRPMSATSLAMGSLVWTAHPYQWPIIGWASDIESYTLGQVQDFFKTYYVPNNITFVMVGDFKADQATQLFERYFSGIPSGANPVPNLVTLEPKQAGERRMQTEEDTTPSVMMQFKTVATAHKDGPALELLAAVLNGKSGRLHKALVLDKRVATRAVAYSNGRKYGGLMYFSGTAADGQQLESVEAAILAEIERIQKEGVTEHELRKVKNQAQADSFRKLKDNGELRDGLAIAAASDTLSYFLEQPKLMEAVTREDIQRVAKLYLTRENRCVALVSRKSKGDEDPEMAKLPEQIKGMVKAQMNQLSQIQDLPKLKEILGKLEGQAGSVPAEVKAGMDYMINKLRARIAKMEA